MGLLGRGLSVAALVAACTLQASAERRPMVTWEEIAAQPVPPADHRLAYGEEALQFGELRLPPGPGPHPVAVVIHGGCWRRANDYRHVTPLAAALTRRGIATWTIEYRRIGDSGGAWPGTFLDVARATDHVRTLAGRYRLDVGRVVLLGHSAGGHLALWVAARNRVTKTGLPGATDGGHGAASPLPVRGVVSLAGITDLREFGKGEAYCNASVAPLLGGTPAQVPERYAEASPLERLPLGVPQWLLHGAQDDLVPSDQSIRYGEQAKSRGDDARVLVVPGAGHFDLIAPFAPAFSTVEEAVLSLLALPPPRR